MVCVLYVFMYVVNKKRDSQAHAAGPEARDLAEKEAIEKGMQDTTELDNPGFRYSL